MTTTTTTTTIITVQSDPVNQEYQSTKVGEKTVADQ